MKNFIKSFVVVFFCLSTAVNASAQSLVTIAGMVTQKKNYEITIGGKLGDKPFRVIQHYVDPTNTNFSFAFPVMPDAKYEMRVVVMKMGHRRLEADYNATLPLNLAGKQKLNLTIDPAKFNQNGAGFKVENLPAKLSTVTVAGVFSTSIFSSDLSLDQVVEGRLQHIQTCFISKGDSSFNFLIPVEKEGFYYLSTLGWKKRLYLKPNDQLQIVLDDKSRMQVASSKSTEENQLLQQWDELISPLTDMLKISNAKQLNREIFTAVYQPLQPKIKDFIQKVKTKNSKYNSLFKTSAKLDNNLLALNMLYRTSSEKRGNFMIPAKDFLNTPDYYKQLLRENKITSADVLKLGEGNEYITQYAKFSLTSLDDSKRKQLDYAERMKLMMNATPNDTLKAFLLKSQLEELELSINNYSEFRDVFLPYQKYAKQPSVKMKYDGLSNMFIADTAFIGKPAYDFTLPDVNGKMVNMKDFKGKVVLIDVWATWCGPCKAQMPFLKVVEEHYKGNDNIVFVGISLDAAKDKQKWLDMLKAKQLEGVQLLDDFGKVFGRKYKMNAIPRFLLVDKNGNWAEVRCPLPEDKEKLVKYIDKELK